MQAQVSKLVWKSFQDLPSREAGKLGCKEKTLQEISIISSMLQQFIVDKMRNRPELIIASWVSHSCLVFIKSNLVFSKLKELSSTE